MSKLRNWINIVTSLLLTISMIPLFAQEENAKTYSSEEAWDYLKDYQFGDDWTPLLLIEDEVEQAGTAPDTQAAMGAKLAGYLTDDSTYACRQFVCMQLRLVGGPAEVPALEVLLNRPEETENARLALEVIPGEESLVPLRRALETFEGTALVGVINSLAKRQDTVSLPAILERTKSEDPKVKSAAVYALGKFGTEGLAALNDADFPVEDQIAGQAALNIADELARSGRVEEAIPIYQKYSAESAQRGCRNAALNGLFQTATDQAGMIEEWLRSSDPLVVKVAIARLFKISDEDFQRIMEKREEFSRLAKMAAFEIEMEKFGNTDTDKLIAELNSEDPFVQMSSALLLGRVMSVEAIPNLLALVESENDAVSNAACEALTMFPKDIIVPLMIEEMNKKGSNFAATIKILASMKAYEAIDPMIDLAKSDQEQIRDAAINGLADLADPDDNDLPRLIDLYRYSALAGYRDKVERTLVLVCKKDGGSSEKVAKLIADENGELSAETKILFLPLLGKLGGDFAYQTIEEGMKDQNAKVVFAAFRGFCNWPDDSHADELWKFAKSGKDPVARQMALRAFIRVVTLKSDRPANETLSMLKDAFALAENNETKQFVLTRAAEIRTIENVEWLAGFIDDSDLGETACASIAKLAHYRELREPNKEQFVPILQKVEATAKDKAVIEAAKKARLGM